MIEDLKINRLELISVCKTLESAMKRRAGTHWESFQFTPGYLKMTSSWGEGTVTTNGSGAIAKKSPCNTPCNRIG
jgi:hypothetical protein